MCNFPAEACICDIKRIGEKHIRINLICTTNPNVNPHDLTIRPGIWKMVNNESVVNEHILQPNDILTVNLEAPERGQRLTWLMKDGEMKFFYVEDYCRAPRPCDCYTCIGIFEKLPEVHSVEHPPLTSQLFTLASLKADKKCKCGVLNLYFRRRCWRCEERLLVA